MPPIPARKGSRDRNARAEQLDDNDIRFETTAPLGSQEGLTVAVGFAKGVIAPPTEAQKAASFLADNGPILVSLLGLVVLFAYYLVSWWRFGRDPATRRRHSAVRPAQGLFRRRHPLCPPHGL